MFQYFSAAPEFSDATAQTVDRCSRSCTVIVGKTAGTATCAQHLDLLQHLVPDFA
jgi:hypothetical protein